jgi:hypothetical protein
MNRGLHFQIEEQGDSFRITATKANARRAKAQKDRRDALPEFFYALQDAQFRVEIQTVTTAARELNHRQSLRSNLAYLNP